MYDHGHGEGDLRRRQCETPRTRLADAVCGGNVSGSDSGAAGCGCLVVVVLLLTLLSQCGGDDDKPDAAATPAPSATASVTERAAGSDPTPKAPPSSPLPQRHEKVTLSLAEIATTPGTFADFKAHVAKYGTDEQQEAVQHLQGWRSYERKWFRPALEASSDYPTIDYEAIDGGDMKELGDLMHLEKQAQHIAEAFAAWWEVDEVAVLQVYDRGGVHTAGTACIQVGTVSREGACKQ